jgi:hypothetical protein
MKRGSIRFLALALLASLAMATSTNAAMILSFGINGPGTKAATVSGSTTTLTTNSPTLPGSFPVGITTIGDVTLPPILTIAARETFTNVTSTGAATVANGTISQPFSGTIAYLDPTNPAINYLTITFAGILRGNQGGFTASLSADNSVAGQIVTFTSTDVRVIPFLNDPIRNFELGLTGLTSGLALSGTTIAPFTTTNQSGNVSSVIPEPSSVVMASTAVLAGLGCFGWRRSRSKSL